MPIVGSLIKSLIDLRDTIVSEPEAEEAQQEVSVFRSPMKCWNLLGKQGSSR